MTTSPWVFYLTFLVLAETAQTSDDDTSFVHQDEHFVSVKVGDNLSLRCSFEPDVGTRFYWYKQILGQKPRLISFFYKYNSDVTFYGEFRNGSRFTVDTGKYKNHLNISDLHISDAGVYYCASSFTSNFDIGEGTIVSVEGSDVNVRALVLQSESESVRPGDSVTLNCTVHTGTCDGEHSVYWFRKSEDPQLGIIYSHGGTNDQCEKKPDTQTHTCDYNLPILDVNHTHAGTYYCAIASCGHIIIGNGTMLDIKDDTIVYFLSGASAFTSILVIVLAFCICMMGKKNNSLLTESDERDDENMTALASKRAAKCYRKEDILQYVATLSMKSAGSRRPTDDIWSECVYFNMKQ